MSGQDITIVIPTYNRYSFLLRLLKYYDKYDHHFHYLILDSSSDELHSDVKPYLEIKNVMYKKYDASIFFAHKIADGCQSITTPFAVLCADDDFLIPIGILASRNFLMENVDYTSAHGFYFIHSNAEDTKKKRFTNNLLYEDDRLVKQDSATERIDAYLSGSISHVFYAVHRTELFQLIWTETKTYVSDWGLSELFPSCMSFVYGKMKKLPPVNQMIS